MHLEHGIFTIYLTVYVEYWPWKVKAVRSSEKQGINTHDTQPNNKHDTQPNNKHDTTQPNNKHDKHSA